MSIQTLYRIYTDDTQDKDALIAAMDACVTMRLPFYYSGRRRVIRVQTRDVLKMEKIKRELRKIGLKVNIQRYRNYYND